VKRRSTLAITPSRTPSGSDWCVRVAVTALLGAAVTMWAPQVRSQAQQPDDGDLDRIPQGMLDTPAESASKSPVVATTLYLEEAPEYQTNRHDLLVPLPGSNGPEFINRFFADGHGGWQWGRSLKVLYSARLDYTTGDPSRDSFSYDLRELFLSWSLDSQRRWFIDFGRVNVRNGVAYAFNPTDFFRTQSVVDETSQDPSVRRENRLGTLMVRGQYFLGGSTLTAIYAPKLYEEPLALTTVPSWPDPQLRRTNADNRVELSASVDFGHDLSPQAVLFHSGDRWAYGVNMARGFGTQTTAYVEWSATRRSSLVTEAMQYGARTGTFGGSVPPIPADPTAHLDHDLAAGVSYTTRSNVNFIAEYDLHQAGLSKTDWRNWFAVGMAGNPFLHAELWYLRDYAAVQQEPISRQSLFLRLAKDNCLLPDLSVSALALVDLTGASGLGQADVSYRVSNRLQLELIFQTALGSRRSDFGSLPVSNAYLFNVRMYL
jgi:hypothetical protein